jgi:hypothetical protein
MVPDSTASTIQLDENRRPKTPAERQRTYRQRKQQQRRLALDAILPEATAEGLSSDPPVTPVALPIRSMVTVAPAALPVTPDVTPVTLSVALPPVTNVKHVEEPYRRATSRRPISSYGLTVAALALAGVGITMNGWFGRTLGSTDLAGWLFLAIGVASDLVALAVPSTAIQLWQARQRATAVVAWVVWCTTFVFAVFAGIGFASLNIADVTLTRASRVTPTVTIAQNALRDAVASRDRECTGGVGRFCREREQTVTERQRALGAALSSVELTADPQTEAAIKMVTWLSAGTRVRRCSAQVARQAGRSSPLACCRPRRSVHRVERAGCVYREPKLERSDGEVHQEWRVI